MQGSFRSPARRRPSRQSTPLAAGAGTDWDTLLTPQLDEQTEREYRDAAGPTTRFYSSDDDASDTARPGDTVPQDPPRAPLLRFQYKGMTIFVLERELEAPLARLETAQYLVPYVLEDDPDTGQCAVPYPRPAMRLDIDDMVAEKARIQKCRFDPAPPDILLCRPGVHYVLPADNCLQIGRAALRRVLEAAQDMDLRFARRVEGLSNVTSSVVWDCLDPEYNPADRQALQGVFLAKYLQRFYAQVGLTSRPPVQDLMAEGVRRHRTFCKEWAKQHHRALTPYVTAPAEVLTSSFYQDMPLNRRGREDLLSCPEMARLFMRHEDTCVEFASCLQYFVATIDQARGTRNASYKQMNVVTMARNQGMRTFGATLARSLSRLRPVFQAVQDDLQERYLSHYTVDWHDILGQIPHAHHAFDEMAAFGMDSQPQAQLRPGDPPWAGVQ